MSWKSRSDRAARGVLQRSAIAILGVIALTVGSLGVAAAPAWAAPPPSVSNLSPTGGPVAGGTSVTITGSNFGTSGNTVKFGTAVSPSVVHLSANTLTAISPAGTGSVDVTVTNTNGTSTINAADVFTYFGVPTVTAVSPSSGPSGSTTAVTITGTNLAGATSVFFGPGLATIVGSCTATTCSVTTGGHSEGPGTVDVTVDTPGGTSATSAADHFTYTGPAVTGVSPTSGPTTGGTSVTITGTDFTGATDVSFGSASAPTFTVNTATQITATSPVHVAGQVDVTVTGPDGNSPITPADVFTFGVAPAPVVNGVFSGFLPPSGPTTGGNSVTITGTDLAGATAVDFGASPATGVSCTASRCTFTAPAGTGTVDVTVTTPSGTSATSAADQYTYVTPPTVTGVSPNSGPEAGGTTVVITGTGLLGAGGAFFGGRPAPLTGPCTATSCTVTAPAGGAAGTVDVTVTTAGGTSATSAADHYTYVVQPVVTSVVPDGGPLGGGNTVTVNGSDLNGATSVLFGATAATGVTCSANSCTVTAPAEAAGTVDVTVTTAGGTSVVSSADQYTYTLPPTVTGVSPIGDVYTGGAEVTITGTNLGSVTSVQFGTTVVTGPMCNATQCEVIDPAGVPGSVVDITVTNPGGTSPTNPADKFTYGAGPGAPLVKGISPNSGPSTGGTVVTITGQGFAGATEVDFGDPPATNVSCTNTQCTATSPPDAPGTVAVTVKGPGGTSVLSPADQFTYTGVAPPPPANGNGYWLVASDGGIFSFGGSQFFGSTGAQHLNKPIVGVASTPDGNGYWLVASDGGIFAFGNAGFFGSTGAQTLNKPIVGMDFAPGGQGYWLVASDGGIFAFGTAGFFGSTGAQTLNKPIVAMVSTPDGGGYWLVASDGGIFAFGDAGFFGSTGAQGLNKPIVGMASTPDGGGYWLVASDGGIFAFGDASFFGSTGAQTLNKPIVGMASSPDGQGYWLVASDGGIFAFGDAPFLGSTGAQSLNQPIVGMSTRF
jgi:hypothetical protein